MTNLIVRPIDDDRYSATSKCLYYMALIEYGVKKAQSIIDATKIAANMIKSRNSFKKCGLVADSNSIVHDRELVIDKPRVMIGKDRKKYEPLPVGNVKIYLEAKNKGDA